MIFSTYCVLLCQCPDVFFPFSCYFCTLFILYSLPYALPGSCFPPQLSTSLYIFSTISQLFSFWFIISATLHHDVISQAFSNLLNSLEETMIKVNDRIYGKIFIILFLFSIPIPRLCLLPLSLLTLWLVSIGWSDFFSGKCSIKCSLSLNACNDAGLFH